MFGGVNLTQVLSIPNLKGIEFANIGMEYCIAPYIRPFNFVFSNKVWGGWCHAQCVMRSDMVVWPEPSIESDLSLFGGVETFSVEHFFS